MSELYKSKNHCMQKGVIFCYNNSLKNKTVEDCGNLVVQQQRKAVCFNYADNDFYKTLGEGVEVYFNTKIDLPHSAKEYVYDLEALFAEPGTKERRALNFLHNRPIKLVLNNDDPFAYNVRMELFNQWRAHKESDPKTFLMTFNPGRYSRSLSLVGRDDVNVVDFEYYVNDELYGIIVFERNEEYAFEISFVSRFFDEKLKLTNDMNEMLLKHAFYTLYEQGVKFVNVEPSGGIKGLKTFKGKAPFFFNEVSYLKT